MMTTSVKAFETRVKFFSLHRLPAWGERIASIRKSVLLMLIFWILIFLAAFYYVEQQVRLQNLNYTIIELKQQKKTLLEQHKTYQLQLHQLTRLEEIEYIMRKQGFAPIEEHQIHLIP